MIKLKLCILWIPEFKTTLTIYDAHIYKEKLAGENLQCYRSEFWMTPVVCFSTNLSTLTSNDMIIFARL